VGIIAYPKNRGFLRSIDQEQYTLEFNAFTTENLLAVIARAWNERADIRTKMAIAVEREKQKARHSASLLSTFLS
jgi:polysaccharide pyruvyl transferase WcaK-like protein